MIPSSTASPLAAVLEHPARYDGATLADPIEGVAYGRCKAKVMRRDDGTPFIHSLAHGTSTIYELRYDAKERLRIKGADRPETTRGRGFTQMAVDQQKYLSGRTKSVSQCRMTRTRVNGPPSRCRGQ